MGPRETVANDEGRGVVSSDPISVQTLAIFAYDLPLIRTSLPAAGPEGRLRQVRASPPAVAQKAVLAATALLVAAVEPPLYRQRCKD